VTEGALSRKLLAVRSFVAMGVHVGSVEANSTHGYLVQSVSEGEEGGEGMEGVHTAATRGQMSLPVLRSNEERRAPKKNKKTYSKLSRQTDCFIP
jgi:hypothetical protein